jgi:hypothetical protein
MFCARNGREKETYFTLNMDYQNCSLGFIKLAIFLFLWISSGKTLYRKGKVPLNSSFLNTEGQNYGHVLTNMILYLISAPASKGNLMF